jgi:hypothetical protein
MVSSIDVDKINPIINGDNHNANPIQMFISKLLDLEKL